VAFWPEHHSFFQISLKIPVSLFTGEDDDFHFFSICRRAVAIGMASPVRGEDDFNLIELSAGGTGDSQLARRFRKFNFNHLRACVIATPNRFLVSRSLSE
jgi:hypothetical protein